MFEEENHLHRGCKNQSLAKAEYSYLDIYLLWKKVHECTVRQSSMMRIERYFNGYIIPELGKINICKIKLQLVQDLIIKWANKTKSYKMIKSYMSKVFDYAIRIEVLEKNPCDYIELPRAISDNNFDNCWSQKELIRFLSLAKQGLSAKWYAFFRVLAFTGMRKGEVLALNWQDIDFENKQIRVQKTLSIGYGNKMLIEPPKTPAGYRTIDIDELTMLALASVYNENTTICGKGGLAKVAAKKLDSNDELVFSSARGKFITHSYPLKVLKRFTDSYKLRYINIHGFRHTHCSLLFESGASIKEVQVRLGHSDVKTTLDTYAHISSKKNCDTINKFSDFIGV